MEQHVVGPEVADGHREGDDAPETSHPDDGLPSVADARHSQPVQQPGEAERDHEPRQVDGGEGGQGKAPNLGQADGDDEVSEEHEDDRLENVGHGLDAVPDRQPGVGVQVGDGVAHLGQAAGDDRNDAGKVAAQGHQVAEDDKDERDEAGGVEVAGRPDVLGHHGGEGPGREPHGRAAQRGREEEKADVAQIDRLPGFNHGRLLQALEQDEGDAVVEQGLAEDEIVERPVDADRLEHNKDGHRVHGGYEGGERQALVEVHVGLKVLGVRQPEAETSEQRVEDRGHKGHGQDAPRLDKHLRVVQVVGAVQDDGGYEQVPDHDVGDPDRDVVRLGAFDDVVGGEADEGAEHEKEGRLRDQVRQPVQRLELSRGGADEYDDQGEEDPDQQLEVRVAHVCLELEEHARAGPGRLLILPLIEIHVEQLLHDAAALLNYRGPVLSHFVGYNNARLIPVVTFAQYSNKMHCGAFI